MPDRDCPFCAIVRGDAPATFVRRWDDAIAIVPLSPVVEGHTLVIPTVHTSDFAEDSQVTARTMRRAAELGRDLGGDMNLITSKGAAATQTVRHLHLHLVPRVAGDGLALPWDPGKRRMTVAEVCASTPVNVHLSGPSAEAARAAGYSAGLRDGYDAGRRGPRG